jgi:hypothetical protein
MCTGAAEVVRHRKAGWGQSASCKENLIPPQTPTTITPQGKEAFTQARPKQALKLNIMEQEQGLKLLKEVTHWPTSGSPTYRENLH